MTDTANRSTLASTGPRVPSRLTRRWSLGGLNLSVEQIMAEMRRGIVHSTSERSISEDEGRFRLTFVIEIGRSGLLPRQPARSSVRRASERGA